MKSTGGQKLKGSTLPMQIATRSSWQGGEKKKGLVGSPTQNTGLGKTQKNESGDAKGACAI